MDSLVPIELLIAQPIAKELQQKGLAELVLRHTDAKYRAFVKCMIPNSSAHAEEKIASLLHESEKQLGISDLRNYFARFDRNSSTWTNELKQLAMRADDLVSKTSILRSLSFLNIGLELANIAVDAHGFKMIASRISSLKSDIQEIAERLDQLIAIKENEKLSTSQNLFMHFNSMLDKLDQNKYIDLDDLEDLIIDFRSFIDEMICSLAQETMNPEITLHIIYTLMPGYTVLLGEFLKLYYFANQTSPSNYELFMSLYDELDKSVIRQKIFDYYMLEKQMSSFDVIDIMNTHFLLGVAGRTQIEQEMDLVRPLGTKEKFEEFEKEQDNAIQDQIANVLATASSS